MVVATDKKITPAEYLEQENQAEEKTEFIEGELFPMSGASNNHNLLTSKLNALLVFSVDDDNFNVYVSDMRVWLKTIESYVYPDIVVTPLPPIFAEANQMELTNPCFIAEVLSPSTARYDKKAKFDLYKTLPTLKEYLILPQTDKKGELYRRLNSNQWLITEFDQETSSIKLESVNLEINLAELYKKVVFE